MSCVEKKGGKESTATAPHPLPSKNYRHYLNHKRISITIVTLFQFAGKREGQENSIYHNMMIILIIINIIIIIMVTPFQFAG